MMKKILFLLVIFSGCKITDKLICYESYLDALKKENEYNSVINSAKKKIPELLNMDKEKLFFDASHVKSAVIDSAIFFNNERDKCLLLVLQESLPIETLDEVLIVQGTKINKEWHFKYDRLPSVPETIYSIHKTTINGKQQENSFKYLSDKGRLFVLSGGTVLSTGCKIDNEYWFGAESKK